MFDIGFLEILVVLVIALLVIGPERMPELARKIGQFMGKMRRFVNSMKEEGQVQETLREIKDSMNFEEEKTKIDNLGKELEQGMNLNDINLDDFQRPFGGEVDPAESVGSNQFNKAPSQPKPPAQPSLDSEETKEKNNTTDLKTDSSPANVSEPAQSAPEKDTQKS